MALLKDEHGTMFFRGKNIAVYEEKIEGGFTYVREHRDHSQVLR